MAENDLGKIVNLIMQNPELIEQIKRLGEKEADNENEEEATPLENKTEPAAKREEAETSAPIGKSAERSKRRELLCALKPYVSEQRGRAIDSMMSIADILDVMRSK